MNYAGRFMHEVGHHLQKIAISKTDQNRDVFARSAFNRYYYGAYLNVRELLSSLNPEWSRPRHRHIPYILTGKNFTVSTLKCTTELLSGPRCLAEGVRRSWMVERTVCRVVRG